MDLGMNYDMPEPCCASDSETKVPKKHYPRVHLETSKELDLPDEGTVTFRFKKESAKWRKMDDGKERYSCELELKEIVKSRKKNSGKTESDDLPAEKTEQALDAIMIAVTKAE